MHIIYLFMRNHDDIVRPQKFLFIHKNYLLTTKYACWCSLDQLHAWIFPKNVHISRSHLKLLAYCIYTYVCMYVHHYSGWPQSCLRHLITPPHYYHLLATQWLNHPGSPYTCTHHYMYTYLGGCHADPCTYIHQAITITLMASTPPSLLLL